MDVIFQAMLEDTCSGECLGGTYTLDQTVGDACIWETTESVCGKTVTIRLTLTAGTWTLLYSEPHDCTGSESSGQDHFWTGSADTPENCAAVCKTFAWSHSVATGADCAPGRPLLCIPRVALGPFHTADIKTTGVSCALGAAEQTVPIATQAASGNVAITGSISQTCIVETQAASGTLTCGDCEFTCTDQGGGSYDWVQTGDSCQIDCVCPAAPPEGECEAGNEFETRNEDCVPP